MVSSSGFSTRSGGSASRAAAALLLGFGALIAWVGARGLADGQPVAALFLLMGLGVLALGVWAWRYRPVASTGNPPVLRANDGLGMAFVGGFAVLWNAVAWPIGFALWREAGGAPGPGWAAALFPLAGLALAVLALRAWVRWRRLGRAALTLRPRQPSLGAPFDARLVFEGARAPLPRDWRVRLKCEEVVMTRGGKGNTRSRRRVLWQHEVLARGDGARVQLRLPAGDPGAAQAHAQASTGQQGDGAIHWTLEFEAQDGDGARSFSLAIDPHDPQAEPLPPLAATAAGPSAADGLAERLARHGIEIGATAAPGGSGQWRFAPRLHRGSAGLLLAIGALFAAVGGTLAATGIASGDHGDWWGGALFATLGSFALAAGALLLTLRSGLRWGGGRARVVWRSLFGGGEVAFDLPQVVQLVPVIAVRTRSLGSERESLAIKAALADGRWLRLGGGIPGRLETQALLDQLQAAWRLRPDCVLRAEGAGRLRSGWDVQSRWLALRLAVAAAVLTGAVLAAAAAFPHDYGWRNLSQSQQRA